MNGAPSAGRAVAKPRLRQLAKEERGAKHRQTETNAIRDGSAERLCGSVCFMGRMMEQVERQPVSLYLHIPFCVRKCRYCDFLSGPAKEEERAQYLAALAREIKGAGKILSRDGREVDTIFFGGGTPTLLSAKEIGHLMFLLSLCFRIRSDAEITMECNPGTADFEKLSALRDMGINRISIGVQSFHDRELSLLGRIHTKEEALHCIESARRAGFANLNLDLMSALPGQTYESWMDNLKTAVSCEPEHLSCYSLIMEEGTPFFRMQQRGKLPPLPSDEEDRRMYHDTKSFLASFGYVRYEISNYAKPGFSCLHNEGYWTGHEYLGLGSGAASLYQNVRFSNTRDFGAYCRAFQEGEPAFDTDVCAGGTKTYERVTREDAMSEFCFLGLRRMDGISLSAFRKRFDRDFLEVFGEPVKKHTEEGLLARDGDTLFLTDRGIDISNYVLCDFLLT